VQPVPPPSFPVGVPVRGAQSDKAQTPLLEYDPAGHSKQAESASTLPYLPTGHKEQNVWLEKLYRPLGQA